MTQLLGQHVGRQQRAIIDETGERSWAELDARANRLINGLRALGLRAGDVIAVYAGNRREYYEIMAAAGHAGLLYVPVNWHFTPDELAYVLANSGAKVLFADVRFIATATAAIEQQATPTLRARIAIGAPAPGFDEYEAFLAASDAAEPAEQTLGGPMFYTSGTTGRPKGVRSTASTTSAPVDAMRMMSAGLTSLLSIPPDGVTLVCGPVYHSAQWAFSYLPLLAGSTVLMRHRFDAAEVLDLIDRYGVTNVHLVPTQFHRLLHLDEPVRKRFSGASLSAVWHGAAPCPPEVKRRMLDWWGNVVHEYYGSTEGSIVTTVRGEEWRARPGTLGQPSPMVEVRILRDDGTRADAGESGRIFVKNRMGSDFEYHNEPEKTAQVHAEPGVFTFGDVGYLDAEGYLYMSDRAIDMVISGGVNIYPAEIEAVLMTHPAVKDAAVFGIPNDEFGEEVKAAIELEAGTEQSPALAEALIRHCREHLAGYKAPRSVDFHESLPRHETGKLYKRLLREKYWEGTGRKI
jgi:long-chain acyl-CoA synthetase